MLYVKSVRISSHPLPSATVGTMGNHASWTAAVAITTALVGWGLRRNSLAPSGAVAATYGPRAAAG